MARNPRPPKSQQKKTAEDPSTRNPNLLPIVFSILIPGIVGAMNFVLPVKTGFWLLLASLALAAGNLAWTYSRDYAKFLLPLLGAALALFLYKATVAYFWEHFELEYQLCPGSIGRSDLGEIKGVQIGLRLLNKDTENIHVKVVEDILTLGGAEQFEDHKNQELTLPPGSSNAYIVSDIFFEPRDTPGPIADGGYSYTLQYGRKSSELNKTLRFSGRYSMQFDGSKLIMYTNPTVDNVEGYVTDRCNLPVAG
ncbi:MAG TPA: hypothetical protein VFH89_10520 [Sphingomicrobium sp.]|nr:hypothetical protein [Sphingomicrobium sp.]